MRKHLLFVSVITVLLTLQGCYVNRHTIGTGPVGKCYNCKKVSGYKQLYLFWGLLPIGNPGSVQPQGGEKGYQIKSSTNIVDMLINGLTFGILSSRTVKYLVRREDYRSGKTPTPAPTPTPPPAPKP